MNKEAILGHLTEASQQLMEIVEKLKMEPSYGIEEFRVEMGHLYHHLNTAWNGRDCTMAQNGGENFNKWRRFPDESELFL